ncbi:hypothetical protein GCM10020358_28270 [Amorphoplanes nipponensis]|uniref:Uncharacterized protein n=1 Tax=Actinoplanes nipponensis TaxID=135950 RepID=A0A919JKK6_9ACTN|nr:hypothetical protein [Actinoplanes nipponensis]GIE48489.1 hypothetical protein Ani05nite_20230 [Actinoplanes nipponensis]
MGRIVIVNGVGISVPGHPVADFFALTPAELTELSYADPVRSRVDPATVPAAERAVLAANRQTIAVFAGAGHLPQLEAPARTLAAVWDFAG